MKKKQAIKSIIIASIFSPVIFLAASCSENVFTQKLKQSESSESLDSFVKRISKIKFSKKSELFFESITINKTMPITSSSELEKIFGIKIDFPKNIKVEITKPLYSKVLNVKCQDKEKTEQVQLKIINFAPDSEYEQKIKNVIGKLENIDKTEFTSAEFKMKWLKDPLETDFAEDIGKDLEEKAKGLQLTVTPSLKNSLKDLNGFKRVIIEKKYDTQEIILTLVASPSDVDYLLYPKTPRGAINNYYRIRTSAKLNFFNSVEALTQDEKAELLSRMIGYSETHLFSKLTNVDYKKLKFSDKSFDDVEKEQFGELVISDTLKTFLKNNSELEVNVSKNTGEEKTTFTINTLRKNNTAKSEINVRGKYSAIRDQIFNPKTKSSGLLFNNALNIMYIFGLGGIVSSLTIDKGEFPNGGIKYDFNTKVNNLEIYPRFLKKDKSKLYFAGLYNGNNTYSELKVVDVGRLFSNDHQNVYTINSPISKLSNTRYIPRFLLPSVKENEFVAIFELNPKNQWYSGKLNVEKKEFDSEINFIENTEGSVGTLIMRSNLPKDGYVARINSINSWNKTQISYFDKNMHYNNAKWDADNSLFKWASSDLIKSYDGGFWLSGKNGEIIYLDSNGTPQENLFINVGHEINSIVTDENKGIIVAGKKGYFAHIKRDETEKVLKIDWEKTIFEEQDIKKIQKDEEGYLYLMGDSATGNTMIEKITPDGLKDAWENE